MTSKEGAGAGRVALVTGGSRGIGLACARALQAKGYKVAVTWKTKAPPLLPTTGDGAPLFPVECDVTDPDAFAGAFSLVEEHLGAVEVLICAAGITEDTLLLRMSEEQWAKVLDTNLTAVYRACKRAAGKMVRQRFGRIVLVSSVVAHLGSPGQTNYAASKAALVGFARSLARELAGRNVTVNVVAPGVVSTDMIARLGEDRIAQLVSMVPIGRAAAPEEVAAAVAFLVADESAYVTGAVLPVDGGLGMGH
ncbi:MAG: 3-oxoacyl-ACP reductase FabG [Acidimicrobiales bacterium]